jgi:hypothetical protein
MCVANFDGAMMLAGYTVATVYMERTRRGQLQMLQVATLRWLRWLIRFVVIAVSASVLKS